MSDVRNCDRGQSPAWNEGWSYCPKCGARHDSSCPRSNLSSAISAIKSEYAGEEEIAKIIEPIIYPCLSGLHIRPLGIDRS